MNAVWNHSEKNWIISFYGSPDTWKLNATWNEGIEKLRFGGYISNNYLVVPSQAIKLEKISTKLMNWFGIYNSAVKTSF